MRQPQQPALSSTSSRPPTEAEIKSIHSGSGWPGSTAGLPAGDANPEAHPYRLRGLWPRPGWSHQMLASDPQVYRGYDLQQLTLSSLPWDLLAPTDATAEEQERVDWVRDGYRDIEGGFVGAAIARPLTSRIYGFSISEIVCEIDDATGLWRLSGLHWIAPWTVRSWVLSLSGHALGALIWDERGERYIPWSKILYDGQMFTGRNYEGIGVTRPLRSYWDHKSQMLINHAIASERASAGIPYADPPPTRDRETYPEEYKGAETILRRIVYGNESNDDPPYYVSPSDGWEIGVNYLDKDVYDPVTMIGYIDHQEAAVLGDTISDLGHAQYGSHALSATMEGERSQMLTGICAIKAHNIDQQVHRLIYDLNGWDHRRGPRTTASGLKSEMFFRRLLEWYMAERPERPLMELTQETEQQIQRILGMERT